METQAPRVRHVPDFVAAFVVFVVACAVFLPTMTTTGVQANDTRAAAVAAYLYAETGSLTFPESWPNDHAYWAVERADGRVSVNRMPGVILTGVPFYAAARLLGVTPRLDAVTHPVFVPYGPAGVAAAVTAALALAALFRLLTQVVSRRDALIATAILGVTTPIWSVAADALWPHATTALMLALVMNRRVHPLVVGAATAVLVMTRPHLVIVPVVFGLARRSTYVVSLAVGGVAGLLLLIGYSQMLFGTWLPASGYDTSGFLSRLVTATPYATAENIGQAWFNVDRGIAIHTPWILLLLPFVFGVWRDAQAFVKRGFIAGLLYFLLQMRMARFSGGSGFAQWRTSLETLLLWAPLLTITAATLLRRYRTLLVVFTAAALFALVMTVRGVADGGRSDWAEEWWAEQHTKHAPA